MRNLPFGFLVIVGADRVRIKIVGKLRQRVIRALQQAHVAAVRIGGDQTMQEAGLILDALGPAVQEEEARGGRVDLDVAHPVNCLVHRLHMMEVEHVGVADGELVFPGGDIHAINAVIIRGQRHRLGRIRFDITDGLVGDPQAAVVDRQRKTAVRRNHIHRQRQFTLFAGIEIADG